jgi:pimeloyl-ACP methyl ester carboxylesterase
MENYRMKRTLCLLGLAVLIAGCRDTPDAPRGPFAVEKECGHRETASGVRVAYDIYFPDRAAGPYPTVALVHGFARNKKFHEETARYLASFGYVVFTPNLISLLQGESAQVRNIAALQDHVNWLRGRAGDDEDPLGALIDPGRVALVGHSAGGSISLETAWALGQAGETLQALVLLDAVPWGRTLERAETLEQLPTASFRSEPAGCNANGQVLDLLAALSYPVDDILISGATHCDPESPTNILCRAACGGTNDVARATYRTLIHAFLADALGATGPVDGVGYGDRLRELSDAGVIVLGGK